MIKEFSNANYGVVRATLIEGEAYFCLIDIAKVFAIQNVQKCRSNIPSEKIRTIDVPTSRSDIKRLFVEASSLSTCMIASKKIEAEYINDWLYRIVLPQLLKYRDYKLDEFKDPDYIVGFIDKYHDLQVRNSVLETSERNNRPKLNFINKLLGTNKCVDLDVVHEMLKFKGIGNNELLKILRIRHVLDENNQPYQEFCDRKYFRQVEAKAVSSGSVIASTRTFVYKSGVTFIERILSEYARDKDAQQSRQQLHSK